MTKKIHMVGIGGIGMSAIARCLLDRGYEVSGSDLKSNEQIERLVRQGVVFHRGHMASNIDGTIDKVIRSAAIKDNNEEIIEAKRLAIDIKKYSEMLGELMKGKKGIAVAGCHGKTTTTSLISYILCKAGLDPTFVCGGDIPQLGGNSSPGKGDFFVAEACEFDRSFLNLHPETVIITNIEEDHLDYYKDIAEIVSAFREFASLTGEAGSVIGCVDNVHAEKIVKEFKDRGIGYSVMKDATWRAGNIKFEKGISYFNVFHNGKDVGTFTMMIPGIFNISNALGAIAASFLAGLDVNTIREALGEFTGAARRFQLMGEKNGITIIDDYAHHPTEVRSLLRAAREKYPDKKIWAIFQPHQHSRTRMMLHEFAESFSDANLVLVPNIFYARDDKSELEKITSGHLAEEIKKTGVEAVYLPEFEDVMDYLHKNGGPDTVALTIGAGNVNEIARRFLNRDK